MKKLQGEWKLVAWERRSSDGDVNYPFGQNPEGLLVYTPTKQMIVQMIAAGRKHVESSDPTGGSETERATAYSGNLSYFGTYEVDGDDVIHTIIGSAYPNWSDTVQRRAFEIDGDTLVLKTQPNSDDPKQVINAMIWRRN